MLKKKSLVIGVTVLTLAFLAGCAEEQGPAEEAGESVDEAMEEIEDTFTQDGPAEEMGESVDEAVDNVTDN